MSGKSIYIASSCGFSESGRDFYYNKLIPEISKASFTPVDPWKLTDSKLINDILSIPPGEKKLISLKKLNFIIGQNNVEGIKRSDAVFAIIDGTDIDSGTASEIGFAYALNKPIIGYRNDFRLCGDNEGSLVNIQVEYFIRASGGNIISNISQIQQSLRDL